ncbi:MAG: bacterioferritin [Gammaproteobacteria bacterium]|nr:MAG: bacterioferritin [Gammaproteobacteria bacterium]RLA11135.1 MAG: bacterioferritin [Gammaproteobacteria bacterium]
MKGNKEVISFLNQVLKMELTAVNQYFLHAKMAANWEYNDFASKSREESIDEMKHADSLIDRILMIEGIPNLQDLGKLYIGEDLPEMVACDLRLEMEAIPLLKEAIVCSEKHQDFISRELFAHILDDEEGHVDWLEAQQLQIEQMGVQNYLQSQR